MTNAGGAIGTGPFANPVHSMTTNGREPEWRSGMVSAADSGQQLASEETRTESDSLGELQIPVSAYYGVQTMRAKENFPISDLRFPRRFIRAIAQIKGAAAETNMDLHLIDEQYARAIINAA